MSTDLRKPSPFLSAGTRRSVSPSAHLCPGVMTACGAPSWPSTLARASTSATGTLARASMSVARLYCTRARRPKYRPHQGLPRYSELPLRGCGSRRMVAPRACANDAIPVELRCHHHRRRIRLASEPLLHTKRRQLPSRLLPSQEARHFSTVSVQLHTYTLRQRLPLLPPRPRTASPSR